MSDDGWDPWNLTGIGVALILATALISGLVVANWTGPEAERQLMAPASPVGSPTAGVVSTTPVVPPPDAIEGCNRQAATEAGQRDETARAVKDDDAPSAAVAGDRRGAGKGIVGTAGGTLYGMSTDRRHDERYRAAYAECMRVRGYTN